MPCAHLVRGARLRHVDSRWSAPTRRTRRARSSPPGAAPRRAPAPRAPPPPVRSCAAARSRTRARSTRIPRAAPAPGRSRNPGLRSAGTPLCPLRFQCSVATGSMIDCAHLEIPLPHFDAAGHHARQRHLRRHLGAGRRAARRSGTRSISNRPRATSRSSPRERLWFNRGLRASTRARSARWASTWTATASRARGAHTWRRSRA